MGKFFEIGNLIIVKIKLHLPIISSIIHYTFYWEDKYVQRVAKTF